METVIVHNHTADEYFRSFEHMRRFFYEKRLAQWQHMPWHHKAAAWLMAWLARRQSYYALMPKRGI